MPPFFNNSPKIINRCHRKVSDTENLHNQGILAFTADLKPRDFNFKSCKSIERIKGPLFEFFSFDRIIVDEYTYIKPKASASIVSLQASTRWALSGTPSVGDFSEVKFMASFIGPNLGEDEISRGHLRRINVKTLLKERTAAETFYDFRHFYSPAYHKNRCAVAKRFMAQFVRQNVAQIDEAPLTEKLEWRHTKGSSSKEGCWKSTEGVRGAEQTKERRSLQTLRLDSPNSRSNQPIARMMIKSSNILDGSWQIRIPVHDVSCINVIGR